MSTRSVHAHKRGSSEQDRHAPVPFQRRNSRLRGLDGVDGCIGVLGLATSFLWSHHQWNGDSCWGNGHRWKREGGGGGGGATTFGDGDAGGRRIWGREGSGRCSRGRVASEHVIAKVEGAMRLHGWTVRRRARKGEGGEAGRSCGRRSSKRDEGKRLQLIVLVVIHCRFDGEAVEVAVKRHFRRRFDRGVGRRVKCRLPAPSKQRVAITAETQPSHLSRSRRRPHTLLAPHHAESAEREGRTLPLPPRRQLLPRLLLTLLIRLNSILYRPRPLLPRSLYASRPRPIDVLFLLAKGCRGLLVGFERRREGILLVP